MKFAIHNLSGRENAMIELVMFDVKLKKMSQRAIICGH
jgi:hypothetical protein